MKILIILPITLFTAISLTSCSDANQQSMSNPATPPQSASAPEMTQNATKPAFSGVADLMKLSCIKGKRHEFWR